MDTRKGITLEIPLSEWDLIGDCNREDADPRSRMLAMIYIAGTLHHLDAIEVWRGRDGDNLLHAANSDFEENLEALWIGFDPGAQYETTRIDEREYLLFMDPGC